MARPKNPRNAFLSALEEASQPIYLLDSEQTLVYMNNACQRWLGISADSALGLKCQASALPIEPQDQNLIRGLLPIPIGAPTTPGEMLCEVFAVKPDNTAAIRLARVVHLSGQDSESPNPNELIESTLVHVLAEAPENPPATLTPARSLADDLRRIVAELAKVQPNLRSLPGIAGRHPLTWRLRKQLEAASESTANVLMKGNEKCLPDQFARSLCNASLPEPLTLPTLIDGRLADEEQLLETLKSISRRLPTDATSRALLLLLRAESLRATVQHLLRDWLVANSSRVRVFSTSSHSLLELAGLQQFDLELAVRLSTIEIEVPTLSARQSDVPAIAAHWLDQFQSSRHAPPITLSREVVEQLLEFRWTGDLEQLRSVLIEAASRLPNGGVLLPEHMPEVIRFGLQAQRIGRPAEQSLNLDSYLEKIERLLLERALQQSGMNKAKAARLLGLTRQRFLRRCEHLQLNFPEEPIDFRIADDLDSDEIDADNSGDQV
ncbi:MAG: helix-turn-helix domain-containing protein [Planctomycetota bacterium]